MICARFIFKPMRHSAATIFVKRSDLADGFVWRRFDQVSRGLYDEERAVKLLRLFILDNQHIDARIPATLKSLG